MASFGIAITTNTDVADNTHTTYKKDSETQRGNRISEYHKYQEMYPSILRDFEAAIEAKREVENALFP